MNGIAISSLLTARVIMREREGERERSLSRGSEEKKRRGRERGRERGKDGRIRARERQRDAWHFSPARRMHTAFSVLALLSRFAFGPLSLSLLSPLLPVSSLTCLHLQCTTAKYTLSANVLEC